MNLLPGRGGVGRGVCSPTPANSKENAGCFFATVPGPGSLRGFMMFPLLLIYASIMFVLGLGYIVLTLRSWHRFHISPLLAKKNSHAPLAPCPASVRVYRVIPRRKEN